MNVELPKMYGWQQKVFFGLKEHWRDSIHVIKSRRQCGKSVLAEIISMYTCLSNKKFRCYILEPTFAQADKIVNEIYAMCKGKPFYWKTNNIRRQIYFKNGSEIRLFSAEQGEEALRGYTCELLIIDEACFISDSIINAVFPYVNVSKGPILLFSTPQGKSGLFYDYYCMGFSNEVNNIFSYDWAIEDVSELLSPAKLELYRKTMDALAFRTDYLGEFLDGQSRFFSDFSACIKDKPIWSGEPVLFGVDWAGSMGGDYTAISILGTLTNTVYDIIYFNDKDPQQTLNEIKRLAKMYMPKKITVELNSIGNVYYNFLKDAVKKLGVPVLGFVTTNDSKDKIISNLQNAFQNTSIFIFRERELMDELQEYTLEFSKTGKRIFNAAKGHHDDLIMSLAIAYNSLKSGYYSVA